MSTRMYKLDHASGGGKRDAEKYFIQCKNPQDTSSWLASTDVFSASMTRAIVEALIHDGVNRKYNKVVIKVALSQTLEKEYKISVILKNIPGFIRYICAMKCNDNLKQYLVDKHASICSYDPHDSIHHVLVMPFMPIGSVRKYEWHRHDPLLFRSCLMQLVLSLYYAFIQYGFLQDIHLDNVLLKHTRKQIAKYLEYEIPILSGLQVCIMDFENAFIPVDKTVTRTFYTDIQHIFTDIKYTMKLRFPTQQQLELFLSECTNSNNPIDMPELLSHINKITIVTKEEPRVLKYDPFVI